MTNKKKKIGVTGSTGVSATLISGTTIHSFLKIGIAKKSADEFKTAERRKQDELKKTTKGVSEHGKKISSRPWRTPFQNSKGDEV